MSTSLNGAKMFVTNGERGHVFAILAKTNPMAQPQQRGISAFIVEKGLPDFRVERKIKKLGYRGLDTCELIFEDCRVPKDRLIGRQGEGFKYVLTCPGDWPYQCCSAWRRHGAGGVRGFYPLCPTACPVGQPICHFQAIQFKLADMATQIEAARLLTWSAAIKHDRGERCDLEAGMAKLFATEMCERVASEGIQIHGGYGYTEDFAVERYFRDSKLLTVGEGTNEIQRLVIARRLVEYYKILPAK